MAYCPEPGCDYPAGTACTMHGCPGRKSNRPPSSPGVAGLADPLTGTLTTFNVDSSFHELEATS